MKIVTNVKKLSKPCKRLSFKDSKEVLNKMMFFLAIPGNKRIRDNCFGLAANQLGYDASVCLIRDLFTGKFFGLINPTLKVLDDEYDLIGCEESCLSIPGKSYNVLRYATIHVEDDISKQSKPYYGFQARIIQHEIDHLNGILISNKESAYEHE